MFRRLNWLRVNSDYWHSCLPFGPWATCYLTHRIASHHKFLLRPKLRRRPMPRSTKQELEILTVCSHWNPNYPTDRGAMTFSYTMWGFYHFGKIYAWQQTMGSSHFVYVPMPVHYLQLARVSEVSGGHWTWRRGDKGAYIVPSHPEIIIKNLTFKSLEYIERRNGKTIAHSGGPPGNFWVWWSGTTDVRLPDTPSSI